MVRVLPVHHFTSQHVHTVEEPVAVAIVAPDRLLVALGNHSVQVRDLADEGHIKFTFPTVDKVQQIVHCTKGDYVAMVEAKPGRQDKVSLHVRVYLNWDTAEACLKGNVVVRARIAGMVTPSSQQCNSSEVIEMIELPIKRTPTAIACSQLSGTIVVACNKSLVMYHYCVRTHNISRHKFFDFTESRFTLELSFAPCRVDICEDVIACTNAEHVHVFKLGDEQLEGDGETRPDTPCSGSGVAEGVAHAGELNGQTDTAPLSTPTQPTNSKDYIDWDAVLRSKQPAKEFRSVLSQRSHPILIDLPSVESQHVSDATCHLQQSPFTLAASSMPVNVKSGSPAAMWTQGVRIAHLLQLRVNPVPGASAGSPAKDEGEEFRCLVLKPYYLQPRYPGPVAETVCNPLRSSSYHNLVGIVCLVTTQQEGYYYFFPMSASISAATEYTSLDVLEQQSACICVYPFTAPVSGVVLETSLLHALTETGLETYTTRSGHHLINHLDKPDNKRMACPSASDPVFLVGLRPFLGCSSNVKHLVLSRSNLAMLAFPEIPLRRTGFSNNWTLYSLTLPAPHVLYQDFLSNALKHRSASPATYCHLLSEGHVMLRTLLRLEEKQLHWGLLNRQYKESCALLADFYLSGTEEECWVKAAPYYHMSGLTPLDVLARLTDSPPVQEEGEAVTGDEATSYVPGLLHYLRSCLLQMNNAAEDVLFTPAVPALLNRLLDLVEANAPDQLSELVLRSRVLRERATDRVLALMKQQLRAKPYPDPADALSLALLCIQKDFPDQATAVLSSIRTTDITVLLSEHSGLLLEQSKDRRKNRQLPAMTELAIVLIDYGPTALSQVLFNVVVAETFLLQHILQVFLELLPRMSSAGLVLQMFLEHYFSWYFTQRKGEEYEAPVAEALKMLVRSYLSELQTSQHSHASSSDSSIDSTFEMQKPKVLFEECRPEFLTMLEGTSVSRSPAHFSPMKEKRSQPTSLSLVKLQSLLSSGKLPPECLAETHAFVKSHPWTHGYLSLLVLCLPTRPAAGVILDLCPEAILCFSQDKLRSNEDWQWVITKLQQKIKSMEEDNFLKETCVQILTAVLTYLSQSLPMESLVSLLPPGEQDMQSYIRTCQEMAHANHINALLSATGNQLLTTLNL